MPAPGGEAAQRQGALQGVTIQEQGDSEATTETDGLCSYQTSSADVPCQVQRDPEDGSGPLQGLVNCPGQRRRQAANCPQQPGWAQDTKECYGLGFRYRTQYYRRNQMDESVPSAVNLFQLPAVQAAFAATATQEDSLLGGGSLLQEACGPLQHADSAGLLGYDVQGAADRNIKTLGSLGVQRLI